MLGEVKKIMERRGLKVLITFPVFTNSERRIAESVI